MKKRSVGDKKRSVGDKVLVRCGKNLIPSVIFRIISGYPDGDLIWLKVGHNPVRRWWRHSSQLIDY